MPIYLVRWPTLSASLVKARSEEELLDILDEVGDSTGCSWNVYRGPLFIDFDLPVEYEVKGAEEGQPIRPDSIVVGDVSRLHHGGLKISDPCADTASDMIDAIDAAAFPSVSAVRGMVDREPTEEELRKAVAADLEPLIRSSWQHANLGKSADPDAELARSMGAPLRLVKEWRKRFVESPPPAEPPPAEPSKAKAQRKPRRR